MDRELNIVGCGRTGRTLGKLFQDAGVFEVQGILTRSGESAREAARFVGAGRPLRDLSRFKPAKAWMIATPDDAIRDTARKLSTAGLVRPGDMVFHLSGALSSAELLDCQRAGARVASVHPMQNFIDPLLSVKQFPGTWCAVEGDSDAASLLQDAIAAVGGRPVTIAPHQKTLYHAGAVICCNYFVALLDLGLDVMHSAGITRDQGAEILTPILRTTLENALAQGTENTMTGPISRGDLEIVSRHMSELRRVSPGALPVYRALGHATLEVVRRGKGLSDEVEERMRRLLDEG